MDTILSQLDSAQKYRDEILENGGVDDFNTQIDRNERYYSKIHLLSNALLLGRGENKSGLEFSWTDSFREDKKAVSPRAAFEKNCILFNLAVLYTKKALSQDRKTATGIKAATQSMLRAASIFAYLVNETKEVPLHERTMDLTQNALCVAALVMQAQAQTCFFEKAQADKFSIELISKLAMSVADMYTKAERNINKDEPLLNWYKKSDYPFHRHISSKKFLFLATASFWASKAALYGKRYGEEITWLKNAEEQLKNTENIKQKGLHKHIEMSRKEISSLVDKELDRAITDNNSIYHYRIPEISELKMPDPKLLAVIKKFKIEELLQEEDKEIIGKLVPVSVARTSRRVREGILNEMEMLFAENNIQNQRHKTLLKDFECFNDGTGDDIVKRYGTLFSDIASLKHRGGSNFISTSLKDLKKTHNDIKAQFESIVSTLNAEVDRHDFNLRKYGSYWDLPAPQKLAESYFAEAKLIEKYITNAGKSNKKMEERFNRLKKSLDFIENQSTDTIAKTLPNVRAQFGNNPLVKEIQAICDLIDNSVTQKNNLLREEKEKIEKENFSEEIIRRKSRHTKTTEENEDKLIQSIRFQRSDAVRTALEQIESRAAAQADPLIEKKREFDRSSQDDKVYKEKQALLSKYQATLKTFDSLLEGLQSGRNFYTDLSALYVNVLLAKVRDFAKTRRDVCLKKVAELDRMIGDASGNNDGYFGDSFGNANFNNNVPKNTFYPAPNDMNNNQLNPQNQLNNSPQNYNQQQYPHYNQNSVPGINGQNVLPNQPMAGDNVQNRGFNQQPGQYPNQFSEGNNNNRYPPY